MANVFLQFLLDAEHGDIDALKRSIENGIDTETRDEVSEREVDIAMASWRFVSGSTNPADSGGSLPSFRMRQTSSRSQCGCQRRRRGKHHLTIKDP